ncbi:hypothetical protein Acsp03_60340 [Actinomadura sp. NBRC 104412]|uniref:hypothetical protein n=1 Tax=Actinomadura sp. NBRC 104412 TaxID=3032203 RepID=UPI0024A14057|nr:hypothetical protein [Actinomadura sp. NBRC 104412]GLZ08568.1 hypothetical protein Acsp03_60340 [Actinomadura sp. NBRC 104412]
MTEQTLASGAHIDTIDTSHLSIPRLSALPETVLKQTLLDALDVTREDRPALNGGFGNKIRG